MYEHVSYCCVLSTWYTDITFRSRRFDDLNNRRVLTCRKLLLSFSFHPPTIDVCRFVAAYVKHSFDIFSFTGETDVLFRISEIQIRNKRNISMINEQFICCKIVTSESNVIDGETSYIY